jgi:Flp pilus assembly protein TadG
MTRRSNESGATAVEFALVAPVVILLIFGALYGGFYYYYTAAAAHVARATARDASIPDHGRYPSAADEMAYAKQAAGRMLPNPTSVAVQAIPAVGEGNAVTVTVTYELPALVQVGKVLPFLPHPGGVITKTVTVRYE